MNRIVNRAIKKGSELFIQRQGPLTRELLQKPGEFGLGLVPKRLQANRTTTMTCGFCSTGCSLKVMLNEDGPVGLVPDSNYPVNLGMACPKGWEALVPLKGSGRATTPLVRRDGKLVEADWESAVFEMVQRFKVIQEKYGPESVAWLGTGQMATEELAFLGALGKFGMGMIHGDGNTRQCMATAAVAYKQAFGFDAPPFTYQDFEESDVIVLVGSNLCIAHPILWERVARNRNQPQVIVIDPRMTETAMAATEHIALKPKSDLTLLYAIANVIIENGWVDAAYVRANTEGFDEYAAHVAKYTPEFVESETGLTAAKIRGLAETIHLGKRVSFWWTMGVNQSHQGVRTAQAIIALALMTGNMGRPGTGANSVTGQCNAMGSRIFSNTTNLFGGRDFTNAEHRATVADLLGIDVARIPSVPGLAYDQIIEAILSGKIRALWVIATNPAHSWVNQAHLRDVFSRLDCLVVQDMYADTETALIADIVLPAAGWGEKEGTFINSERRVGLIKKVSRAPGEALADFHIFQLIAEAWGVGDMFRRWSSPEAVFQILKQLSKGQPCDITGIEDYTMLERQRGIQWPCPEGYEPTEPQRRLFEDGKFYTPNGRARFLTAEPRPLPEAPSPAYPLLLLTGRGSSSQWHTLTRTKRSAILRKLSPSEPYVEISLEDAQALSVRHDEWVSVQSQRGSMKARAFITRTVTPGQVFIPMHYEEMNRLTFPAFDPFSRQPAYKACAVRISRTVDIAR